MMHPERRRENLKKIEEMDREKVIKGLKCHQIDKDHRINCSDCPYHCDEFMNGLNELHNDAIELLKEQEAKTGEWIYKHDNLWYCSKCGEIIYSETDEDLEVHHAYCSRCGAKMKQEGR